MPIGPPGDPRHQKHQDEKRGGEQLAERFAAISVIVHEVLQFRFFESQSIGWYRAVCSMAVDFRRVFRHRTLLLTHDSIPDGILPGNGKTVEPKRVAKL
jgi:hypothetical protein